VWLIELINMRAVIIKEHGDIDRLIYTSDAPKPQISNEEALIRVKACALNHLDIWTRQGIPGIKIPMPHILGCDISGEVAEIKSPTSKIKEGTKVVVSPGISCGQCEFCKIGWDSLCDQYQILGFQVDGGYAEFAKVPIKNLISVSNRYSFEEWAACPLVYVTVWHMLITRAELKEGETILIHAAGSGIGSAAIQLAKMKGAKVITTVGSDTKEKKAKELGADHIINYKNKDFVKEIQTLTKGKGVQVVFEHIGAETFTKSLACLSKKGRLVTCGVTSGANVQIDLRFLYVRQHSLMGSYMGGKSELDQAIKHLETGQLKPVVDSVFPLEKARDAHKQMLDRKNFGKIVLKMT